MTLTLNRIEQTGKGAIFREINSVTRLDEFQPFGRLFKACGNIFLAQNGLIFRKMLKSVQVFHFWLFQWQLFTDIFLAFLDNFLQTFGDFQLEPSGHPGLEKAIPNSNRIQRLTGDVRFQAKNLKEEKVLLKHLRATLFGIKSNDWIFTYEKVGHNLGQISFISN